MVAGGWMLDENMKACNLPQKVATAFSEAVQGLVGATYMPVLYCGSQVVAGTNYKLVCKQTLATKEPTVHLVVMAIHVSLEGKAVIMTIDQII